MGVNDRDNERKYNKRQQAKNARRRRADSGETADLDTVDWVLLAAFVTEVAKADGAVRIGYTRDGGAYAIGVYMGDDYATEYVRPSEDFGAALFEIAAAWLPDKGVGLAAKTDAWRGNHGD